MLNWNKSIKRLHTMMWAAAAAAAASVCIDPYPCIH
jgi:hypothetical protein